MSNISFNPPRDRDFSTHDLGPMGLVRRRIRLPRTRAASTSPRRLAAPCSPSRVNSTVWLSPTTTPALTTSSLTT